MVLRRVGKPMLLLPRLAVPSKKLSQPLPLPAFCKPLSTLRSSLQRPVRFLWTVHVNAATDRTARKATRGLPIPKADVLECRNQAAKYSFQLKLLEIRADEQHR